VLPCITPALPRIQHPRTRHKGPVRAGLRLGSPSTRAPKSDPYTHPLGGICRVPWVEGGVTSKRTIGHLILIHLWPKVDKTEKKKVVFVSCVNTHKTRPSFVPGSLLPVTLPLHARARTPTATPFHVPPLFQGRLCNSLLMGHTQLERFVLRIMSALPIARERTRLACCQWSWTM
jgi:hypothetical protein